MRSGLGSDQQMILYGDKKDIRGVIDFVVSKDGAGKEVGHHNVGVLFRQKKARTKWQAPSQSARVLGALTSISKLASEHLARFFALKHPYQVDCRAVRKE